MMVLPLLIRHFVSLFYDNSILNSELDVNLKIIMVYKKPNCGK